MNENLALWKLVERTDPAQVKPITGKPYKGSSPKPFWLIQKATETFGPCGIGWGFHVISERVEDGATGDKVHIAHLRVWYKWKGEKGEVEHVGQTMFAGKNKNGPFTDEDAPKKSVTDALVKALSMIGFAGDIFTGRYNDSKYVNDLREEFSQARHGAAAEDDPFANMEETPARAYLTEGLKVIAGWTADVTKLTAWWHSEAEYRAEAGVVNGTAEYKELFEAFKAKGLTLAGGSSPRLVKPDRAVNTLRSG